MTLPILNGKLTAQIVKVLGPHGPDAVLAVFIFLGVLTAIGFGVNFIAAGVFGIVLYALYGWRKSKNESHLERMADANVRRVDAEVVKAREKHAQKIEKVKAALPKPPDRGPSRGAAGGRRGSNR